MTLVNGFPIAGDKSLGTKKGTKTTSFGVETQHAATPGGHQM